MDLKKAKQILTDANLEEFSNDKLHGPVWYLSVSQGDEKATLDGEFTADDIEAIATWMRDPSGVVDA